MDVFHAEYFGENGKLSAAVYRRLLSDRSGTYQNGFSHIVLVGNIREIWPVVRRRLQRARLKRSNMTLCYETQLTVFEGDDDCTNSQLSANIYCFHMTPIQTSPLQNNANVTTKYFVGSKASRTVYQDSAHNTRIPSRSPCPHRPNMTDLHEF